MCTGQDCVGLCIANCIANDCHFQVASDPCIANESQARNRCSGKQQGVWAFHMHT